MLDAGAKQSAYILIKVVDELALAVTAEDM